MAAPCTTNRQLGWPHARWSQGVKMTMPNWTICHWQCTGPINAASVKISCQDSQCLAPSQMLVGQEPDGKVPWIKTLVAAESKATCNVNFRSPVGSSIQEVLLHTLEVLCMLLKVDMKDISAIHSNYAHTTNNQQNKQTNKQHTLELNSKSVSLSALQQQDHSTRCITQSYKKSQKL